VGNIFFAPSISTVYHKVTGFNWVGIAPFLEAKRVNNEQYTSEWVEGELVDCQRWSFQEAPRATNMFGEYSS
jgi:hypothetical protein